MPITIVQQTPIASSGSASALTLTFPSPTTAGNGIVVVEGFNVSSASAPTDGQGNTFASAVAASNLNSPVCQIWYCTGALSVSSVQANFGSSGACCAIAYEVLGTLALDQTNHNTGNNTSQTPGSITTGAANTIIFAVSQDNTPAAPAGWVDDGAAQGGRFAHLIATTVQTVNPAFTIGGSNRFAAVVTSFTSSNSNPPPTWPPLPPPLYPFLRGRPPVVLPPPAAVAPAAATAPSPVASVSPAYLPFPIALKLGLFRIALPPPPSVQAPPPVPPPTPLGAGHGKYAPFVRRLPNESDPRRAQRITDQLSGLINSLIGKGQLRQLGTSEWVLIGSAHTDTRDPLAADDAGQGFFVGAQWINTTTQAAFVCVSSASAAAVWKQVT